MPLGRRPSFFSSLPIIPLAPSYHRLSIPVCLFLGSPYSDCHRGRSHPFPHPCVITLLLFLAERITACILSSPVESAPPRPFPPPNHAALGKAPFPILQPRSPLFEPVPLSFFRLPPPSLWPKKASFTPNFDSKVHSQPEFVDRSGLPFSRGTPLA